MKEVQEDNFPSHKLTKHNNDPTCKALIPLENKQQKLCFSSTVKVSKSDNNSNNQKEKDDPDDPPEDPEDGDTPGSALSATGSLPLHVLPGLTAKLVKTQGAQHLFVFIEGSPKRHHQFLSTTIPDSNKQAKTLKNLSGTRWALQAESVTAIHSEFLRVIKSLDSMQDDPDPKTSSQASSLLSSIVDEEFIFNINMLKVVLTPTSRLSDYLQGRNIDIRKAHENVQLVVETLEKLRSDEAFNDIRVKSNDQVTEVLKFIETEELACSLKKVQVPRASKEWKGDNDGYLRVNIFFQTCDRITSELHRRFDPESKTIINSLAAVCFDEDVEKEVFEKVGDYYSLETDQLIMDHKMFQVFKVND